MQIENGLHLPPSRNSGMATSPPPWAKLHPVSATLRARSALSCGVMRLLCAGGDQGAVFGVFDVDEELGDGWDAEVVGDLLVQRAAQAVCSRAGGVSSVVEQVGLARGKQREDSHTGTPSGLIAAYAATQ